MNAYQYLLHNIALNKRLLAILIDPDKFNVNEASSYLNRLPQDTTHIFVGGSTVEENQTEATVKAIKKFTKLPVFIFPGHHTQIAETADALLFLSLLSGRNPEYLIGQQVKAAKQLQQLELETISTAYLLIDGGNTSAVASVTQTFAMPQDDIDAIVATAKAGELMGARLIYLEAGSGAKIPVAPKIIKAVKEAVELPIIVGGGIRDERQKEAAYKAGAAMVVMGTVFEE